MLYLTYPPTYPGTRENVERKRARRLEVHGLGPSFLGGRERQGAHSRYNITHFHSTECHAVLNSSMTALMNCCAAKMHVTLEGTEDTAFVLNVPRAIPRVTFARDKLPVCWVWLIDPPPPSLPALSPPPPPSLEGAPTFLHPFAPIVCEERSAHCTTDALVR